MTDDKRLHLIAGFCISLAVIFYTHNVIYGVGMALLAGIAKEARDKISGKGTVEVMDIVYTLLGGIIATIILF